ncbi:hypothetical protein BDA99DRAFT_562429 [Phascolomyces articulosus]|uniref:Uncharacterized protein n=1 Tax=Phascolomyces articulosus TaxID=60185 RepID=A0AAD5JUL3_9FUNG|nr:hypothetical protein BDA99DRAFT_562429 [Phascolomyces articulosus]
MPFFGKKTLATLGMLMFSSTAFIQQTAALAGSTYASSISECPQLTPRTTGPTSPRDLRPDDIKVIAALGDSIMAGFALEGINDGEGGTGILNISAVTEFRGQSWGIGGDDGAITLANFVNHYNSSLEGPSEGSHIATICHGTLCLDMFRNPKVDVLNAALSGAIAMNLDDELDYLIPRMKELPNVNFETDWKMITIQIGSNDQCASCLNPFSGEVTTEKFGGYIEAAIERIRNEVPRVLVNLAGSFHVSDVYELTKGQEYCRPLFNNPDAILNRVECSCFLEAGDALTRMDALSDSYNDQIMNVYNKYKAQESDQFALRYTPANINVGGFPLEVMSNVDCFHPGKLAHQWVAKVIWNTLFLSQAEFPEGKLEYDANQQIYCPTDDDRFRVD